MRNDEKPVRVLAIDIGLRHAAFVVVEGRQIIASDRFVADRSEEVHEVIREQVERFLNLLARTYHGGPYIVAIESPYLGQNRKTFYTLAQLVGAMKAAAVVMHGYPIELIEATANTVRLHVAGHGSISKETLYQLLFDYFDEIPTDRYFDSSDALALALYARDKYNKRGDHNAEEG